MTDSVARALQVPTLGSKGHHGYKDRMEPDSEPREHRKATLRIVRAGEEERAADAEFWVAVSPEQRVEALWEMVQEARRIQGLEGDEPRLLRSVLRVERR